MSFFELETYLQLGHYQAAINTAGKIKADTDAAKVQRDVLLYRAFLEQGDYAIVLTELSYVCSSSSDLSPSAPLPLAAVRLLAQVLSGEVDAEQATATGIPPTLPSSAFLVIYPPPTLPRHFRLHLLP